ncbi:MAG: flagellar hook-associated protein FlgL [Methylomonas lenta]|nr:flagellar hook-associated protein FlgL [Methylomonas lenta]
MRVSTTWQQQLSVNAMLNQQSKLSQTQLKLSSGQKYLTPSENTVAATGLIDLQQNIKENQQYQVNINSARQRLELQESNLSNATETVQKIRELAVQGLNDSNNAENRKQIAVEIDELNKHLLGIANTQNANGEYIFSGYKTDVPAYSNNAGYTFDGERDTQRSIAIGPGRLVTDGDPGNQVFGEIVSGPLIPGSITNLFQAVSKLSADLQQDSPDSRSLTDLDEVLKRFDTTRASTGARLNALDSQENLNADYILDNQSTASEMGDLDYAEALSKFNLQQLSLQAAQQAYTKVQNLSLFNYL